MTLLVLSLLGVVVFAASGALSAGRKQFDLLGVAVIAVTTALGGGTIRDLLLDRTPFWIAEPSYLWTAVGASALTIVYVRLRRPPWSALLMADALGLAFFTIVGAQVAEDAGHGGIIVVVMAAFTGVAGGVLRDVLCAEVPLLFRRVEMLYGTAAIAGASVYLGLQALDLARTPSALLGMAVIAVLRFAAILWRLQLPTFHVPEEAQVEREG